MFLSRCVPLPIKKRFWSIRERFNERDITWNDLRGGLNKKKNLKNKFCDKPWEDFDITSNGDVYVCCTGWLPKPVGNIKQNNIIEIWNSEQAQEIRKSILDGSFKYCNHDVCWHIQKGNLPDRNNLKNDRYQKIVDKNITSLDEIPSRFSFIYDASCN